MDGPILIAQWAYYWTVVANVGYGQDTRDHKWDGGAMDCSSLAIECARLAGYHTGAAHWTGNMRQELVKHGWKWLPKFSYSDLKVGDLILANGHVVIYVGKENGRHMIAEAALNEHGDIVGGKDGDQTGQETRVTGLYHYPGGWTGIIRPPAKQTNPGGAKRPPHLTTEENDVELSDVIKRPDGHKGSVHDVLGYMDWRVEKAEKSLKEITSTVNKVAKAVADLSVAVKALSDAMKKVETRDAQMASRVRDTIAALTGYEPGKPGDYKMVPKMAQQVEELSAVVKELRDK